MSDPTLYLYTSLTAGSSHIITATSRVETILKANKLPYRIIDLATDDVARKLWTRRSMGKKMPGLVKYGNIVGDLEEIEEWNEFGELRMVINSAPDLDGTPATSYPMPIHATPKQKKPKSSKTKPISPKTEKTRDEEKDSTAVLALRTASAEAASKAKSMSEEKEKSKAKTDEPKPEPEVRKHRGSVAAELPDTEKDSPKSVKRPALVPEFAAVSTANFRADNAEALGLVQHHHSSIISISDKEENDKVVHEIRASISEDPVASEALENIRKEAAEKGHLDVIDVAEAEKVKSEKEKSENEPVGTEEPTPVVEKSAVLEEVPVESKPVVEETAIEPVAEESAGVKPVVEESAGSKSTVEGTAEVKSAVATATEEVPVK